MKTITAREFIQKCISAGAWEASDEHLGNANIHRPDIDALEVELTAFAEAYHAQKEAEKWISVKDRLPDKVCLAYYKNEFGNERIVKAKYTTQYSEEANTDDDWVEYNEADDTYYYPAGWYEMIDNWGDFSFVTINSEVTHWQPLPPLPISKDGE